MASAVQLNLTSEQASLILPVLQNALGSRENCSNNANLVPPSMFPVGTSSLNSSGSSVSSADWLTEGSTDFLTNDYEGTIRFTAEELLQKKKKNTKSTKAQNFFHVS